MLDSSKKRFRFRVVAPAYPAFNIYSRIAATTTALGPLCVATAANKMPRWDVEVIDENNLGRFGPRAALGADHVVLQKDRPADIVGFYGGLTSTAPRIYELAHFYKQAGIVTIAGGQHFAGDNIAEGLAHGIDYIVLGEAEETIVELLQALQDGQSPDDVAGLAFLRDGKVFLTAVRDHQRDFDKLPLPDFSLVRYAQIKIYPVERIRGCGMDCEFCTVRGKPRCASPERLMEHIKLLVETRRTRRLFVVDDLFGQQRDETLRLCRMLADYQRRAGWRLDITVQIRLDKARDTELLTAMRAAGINTLAIGFESPIESDLAAMSKHVHADDMLALARQYREHGFLIHGMFIFGYPMQTPPASTVTVAERVRQYRRFIRKARLDTLQVLLPVPLPGTELRTRLDKQGRIYPLQDVGWEYYDGNFPLFEPDDGVTPQEMLWGIRRIMGKFYRFRYLFLIPAHIFVFSSMVFFLHNIRAGWRIWYRNWRNYHMRFGGWVIMRAWLRAFDKDTFMQRLNAARHHLHTGH